MGRPRDSSEKLEGLLISKAQDRRSLNCSQERQNADKLQRAALAQSQFRCDVSRLTVTASAATAPPFHDTADACAFSRAHLDQLGLEWDWLGTGQAAHFHCLVSASWSHLVWGFQSLQIYDTAGSISASQGRQCRPRAHLHGPPTLHMLFLSVGQDLALPSCDTPQPGAWGLSYQQH